MTTATSSWLRTSTGCTVGGSSAELLRRLLYARMPAFSLMVRHQSPLFTTEEPGGETRFHLRAEAEKASTPAAPSWATRKPSTKSVPEVS